MNSLVSVVIPTRNRYKYLTKCINSIEKQTYKPIEIIIIDDCSTDETKKIQEINEITYVRNKKCLGAIKSYTKGRKIAKGSFIAHTDDDCVVEKNWIEVLMEEF